MNVVDMHAHRAGRLVLALADEDVAQAASIGKEAAAEEGGIFALLTAMASVTAASAQATFGAEWRTRMVAALHGLELGDEDV